MLMNGNNHASHRPSLSTVWILLSLTLIAAGCAGAATTTTTLPAQPSFAGMWEGTFDAGEIAGDMRLVLNKEGDSYTGVLQVTVQGESISGDIFNFESEGNSFTFASSIEDFDLLFKGTIEESKLTGLFEAYMGSEMMGEGTFNFIKRL